MTRHRTLLSDEDRVLWSRVARSARPLRGKSAAPDDPIDPFDGALLQASLAEELAPERQTTRPAPRRPKPNFDTPTRNKLSKGRLPIDGRVDLHGMTQGQAHTLLLSFLHRAHAGGMRYVLVITGKGSSLGSDGVLRRAVPDWLATPSFRAMVGSYDAAARHHGGAGALYVKLRRTHGGDRG